MAENEIAKAVFDAGMRVHNTLGPGLLESVFETRIIDQFQYDPFRNGFKRVINGTLEEIDLS